MTLYSKLVWYRRSRLTTNHMQAYLLVICPASQSLTTTIYNYCIVPLVAAVVICQWLQRWSTARHLAACLPAGLPARRPAAGPPAGRLRAHGHSRARKHRCMQAYLVCRRPPTGGLPAD